MVGFLAGIALLALVLLLLWLFTTVDPASLVRLIRYLVAMVFLGTAAVFAFGGRWSFAIILGTIGISAITMGRIGPLDLGGGRRSSGSSSTVRSAFLAMRLEHDSGTMTGTVTAGRYAGQSLGDLTEPSLRELLEEVAGDANSVALLEGYLDRRFAGWREHVEGDEAARPRSAPDAGAMTDKEAYEILGLAPGASEADIRAAHRRLMAKFHPDVAGSSYLAAKINQAKDWLLGRHGKRRTRGT
jgi:hypothetical protein